MIMPLNEFPAAARAEIERVVALPEPPPKYKLLGHPDSPRPVAQIISRAWYEWHLARGHKFNRDHELRGEPSTARRGWQRLSRTVRPIVLARDGYQCQQCGADGSLVALHIDHIVALAKGGTNDLDNLQVLCQPCNQRKWAH